MHRLCSGSSGRWIYARSFHLSSQNGVNKSFPIEEPSKIKEFDEIPGPKPLPIVGNLWRYIPGIGEYSFKRLHRTYEKMYYRYGPLVKEKVFADRVLVHVYNPEDMEKVYNVEVKDILRKSHQSLGKYRMERPHLYKSAGLFPSNGEEWYNFRKLFEDIFLNLDKDKELSKVLESVTDDLVKKLPLVLDSKGEVDIQPEIFKWAIESVGAVTMNTRLGCLSPESNDLVQKFVKAAQETQKCVFRTDISPLYKYFRTPNYRKLEAAQDYIASVVTRYMGEAIAVEASQGGNKPSLLTKLLNVKQADYKDVFTMIVDMFLAGTDGISYAVAYAFYNLALRPEVQQKLRLQLIQRLPRKDSLLSSEDTECEYLRAVIKEVLRINPVTFGNGRILPDDMILSGYRVKKGTQVLLQHQVASKLAKNFPGPAFFRPERWLEKTDAATEKMRNVTCASYGLGPRNCLGYLIAERQLYLIIGKVIRNFKIEYHYDYIDSVNRLVNVPDKPVTLRFYPVEQ